MSSSISISSLSEFKPHKEEWDYLIILDAMRYDYFKRLWLYEGELSPALALGSCTLDFLKAIPKLDAVCFSSHPFILQAKTKFKKVIECGWNHLLGTCLPQYVTSRFLREGKPKPSILWYIQPHHPYIGGVNIPVPIFRGLKLSPQGVTSDLLAQLKVKGVLLKAYEANARYVITHIRFSLLPHLRGKIIITSDHAEGLGEPYVPEQKPVFSHPCGLDSLELRLIPVLRLEKP